MKVRKEWGCPKTKNRSNWCFNLCTPKDGIGECGRVAPSCILGKTQKAILNHNEKDGWIEINLPWISYDSLYLDKCFIKHSMYYPGVEIEVKTSVGLKRYVIGDISKLGGMCDCCMEFQTDDIVIRARDLLGERNENKTRICK